MDWTDKREIKDLNFGAFVPEEKRDAVLALIKGVIAVTGAKTADDVAAIGCTTLAAHGFTVDESKEVRLGFGGSGIGLTCYVPLSRYCFVHEIAGGLQDNQEQRYADHVEKVSRELTPQERFNVGLVDAARRKRGTEKDAHDVLIGHDIPAELIASVAGPTDEAAGTASSAPSAPSAPTIAPVRVEVPVATWKCELHVGDPKWDCRFCVAQAVVEGPLQPVLIGVRENAQDVPAGQVKLDGGFSAADVDAALQDDKCAKFLLFVQAASWTRRLARDV